MATERTHYDVLGVGSRATDREIRAAYRAKARRMHPDVARTAESGGSGDPAAPDMADVNRAWFVLSDSGRRRMYDLSLHDPGASSPHQGSDDRRNRVGGQADVVQRQAPARFPWRGMLIVAVVGITFVLVADATSTPPTPARPDQLLQGGSCVRVDERSEVYEVSCSDPHDGVVRQLVAMDRPCPVGTEPHRDRQGMGLACIDRAVVADSSGD